MLKQIQIDMFAKANNFKNKNTFIVNDFDDFEEKINSGGFVLAHWDGSLKQRMRLKRKQKLLLDVSL